MSAGTMAPPTAATMGSSAFRGSRSSPMRSSRLISRPTTRKKMAIRPSFTQWSERHRPLAVTHDDAELRVPQGIPGRPPRASWRSPARPPRRPSAGSRQRPPARRNSRSGSSSRVGESIVLAYRRLPQQRRNMEPGTRRCEGMSESTPPPSRPRDRWSSHPMRPSGSLGRLPPGALLLSVLTFASYVVGLLRDRVFARTFGAGSDLDVYNAALVLPELVLDVLVFAGLSAAFVPVLLRTERDDPAAGDSVRAHHPDHRVPGHGRRPWPCCSSSRPWTAQLVAPGFDAQQVALYTSLFRQMCVTALVFAVSFALGELLVARQRFLAYGLAPLLYNLGIVLGAVILGPRMGIEGVADRHARRVAAPPRHPGRRCPSHRLPISARPGRPDPRVPGVRPSARCHEPSPNPSRRSRSCSSPRSRPGMAAGSVSSVSFARNFQSVPGQRSSASPSRSPRSRSCRGSPRPATRRGFARLVRDNVLTIGVAERRGGRGAGARGGARHPGLPGWRGASTTRTWRRPPPCWSSFAISVPLEALSHVLSRADLRHPRDAAAGHRIRGRAADHHRDRGAAATVDRGWWRCRSASPRAWPSRW